MKTPREILFEHHRNAGPKLDAIRRRALAELPDAEAVETAVSAVRERQWIRAALEKPWLGLIWPCRRVWAGMAVLWLAVLAANLQMRVTSPSVPRGQPLPAREIVRALQEQQRFLTELLPATEPQPAPLPRTSSRPRTERALPFKTC